MDFSQDLVKGSIVPVVLALLRERPMYGYEMVKLVNAPNRRPPGAARGHSLSHIAQARSRRLGQLRVERRRRPPGQSRPLPQYYSITVAAAASLQRRAGEWREFSNAVNRVLDLGGAKLHILTTSSPRLTRRLRPDRLQMEVAHELRHASRGIPRRVFPKPPAAIRTKPTPNAVKALRR